MKKLLKRPILSLIEKMAGKKRYQNFFIVLSNLAIKGLNLRNINIENNGELFIIKQICRFYSTKKEKKIILFDVGANQGNYSETLLKEFSGQITELHAFEPLVTPFQELQTRIKDLNQSRAFVYNFGLGNHNGMVEFFVDNDTSELGSIFKRDLSFIDIKIDEAGEIEIRRADDFCQEKSVEHIHFMKIDVEGAEIEVFKGAGSFLEQSKVDFIQFEFGSGNVDSKTYMSDFFKEIGNKYELFRILKDGVYPMRKYTGDYEVLVMGNYFAISKALLHSNEEEVKRLFNFE